LRAWTVTIGVPLALACTGEPHNFFSDAVGGQPSSVTLWAADTSESVVGAMPIAGSGANLGGAAGRGTAGQAGGGVSGAAGAPCAGYAGMPAAGSGAGHAGAAGASAGTAGEAGTAGGSAGSVSQYDCGPPGSVCYGTFNVRGRCAWMRDRCCFGCTTGDYMMCWNSPDAARCGSEGEPCVSCVLEDPCILDECVDGTCRHTPLTGVSCGSLCLCDNGEHTPCGRAGEPCCFDGTCALGYHCDPSSNWCY